MNKAFNLVLIPAAAVIIIAVMSSFADQSSEIDIEKLLRQRTSILQGYYYGQISREVAEKRLLETETYPLVSDDIAKLNGFEDTEVDVVNSMEFIEIVKNKDFLSYQTYNVAISWQMTGLAEQYTMRGDYYVVLKNDGSGYKLAKFDAM